MLASPGMSDAYRPVYRRIADSLRTAIESGDLAPGDKLPSEAELMTQWGRSLGTVRQALAVLRNEGLVAPRHGRGVFVLGRENFEHLLPALTKAIAVAERDDLNLVLDLIIARVRLIRQAEASKESAQPPPY